MRLRLLSLLSLLLALCTPVLGQSETQSEKQHKDYYRVHWLQMYGITSYQTIGSQIKGVMGGHPFHIDILGSQDGLARYSMLNQTPFDSNRVLFIYPPKDALFPGQEQGFMLTSRLGQDPCDNNASFRARTIDVNGVTMGANLWPAPSPKKPRKKGQQYHPMVVVKFVRWGETSWNADTLKPAWQETYRVLSQKRTLEEVDALLKKKGKTINSPK